MVRISRFRTASRRFAVALAVAQLTAYAVAPALEARTTTNPGPVHIERAQDRSCMPVHAPDACLACQLLGNPGETAGITRVPTLSDSDGAPDSRDLTLAAPRPPPANLRSRAPPLPLA